MQPLQKLIDYFVVVGLKDKLTLCNYALEEERRITSLRLFFGFLSDQMKNQENEKWIDLDGYQTVWLKASFNEGQIPITSVDFVCVPTEGNRLKWNESSLLQPVPIINLKPDNLNEITKEKKLDSLTAKEYDLTELLGFERVPGHAIVLCYNIQEKIDYQSPLEDIDCVVGERKRGANGLARELIHHEKGYNCIERRFVNKDKSFRCLVYKKGRDFLANSFESEVIDRYPQGTMEDTQEILGHIHLFCFPDGVKLSRQIREPIVFSFILTKESGARVFGTALVFDEDYPEHLKHQLEYGPITKENPLFTQKAICLLSHYSFSSEFKEILKQIYRIHLSRNEVPIERVICNLLDETPLPVKGKVEILVDLGQPVVFKRAANYPLVAVELNLSLIIHLKQSRAVHNLFKVFNPCQIIELMKITLLEKKILLISKYKSLLTDIAEAITGFLFPFVWVRPLIPILPSAWKDCLECPLPFIIGLDSSNLIDEEDLPISDDVFKVYLDKGELSYSEKVAPLPEKMHKNLLKRLEVFDEWHQVHRKTNPNYDSAFEMQPVILENEDICLNVYEIQDAFFGLTTSILKHYNKFFLSPKENKSGLADLKETFDIQEFLKKKKSNKEGAFLYKLVHETSFFSNFVQSRASFYQQGVEYQFIDNCIKKKRTKKEPLFIHKPEIEITFSTYAPNRANLLPESIIHSHYKLSFLEFYVYQNFPKLNPELFIEPRIISKLSDQDFSIKLQNIEPQKLANIDDSKWAKLMLESIYTIWFSVFNIVLKEDFKESFSKLSEYAVLLFEDAQNRNIKPNEIMYKSLIEALCYCDMNEKALQIVNSNKSNLKVINLIELRESKTDLSPFAFGIYLDTMSQARKFRYQNLKKSIQPSSRELEDQEKSCSLEKKFFSPSRCLNFQTADTCPNCSEVISAEDIMGGWTKSCNEYTTRCQFCGKSFLATFKVLEQHENSQIETPIHFLSPLIVRKEFENLVQMKGSKFFMMESFEKEHKTIFWNIYLYFSLIKAPTFFFESNVSENQILNTLKYLEEQIKTSQGKKGNWNFSFFSQRFKSKSHSVKEESSHLGIEKQHGAKTSESTKISNDSMRMTIINDSPDTNSHIKKLFSGFFSDLRKELDRKLEDHELEVKLKKGGISGDSGILEQTADYCKSPGIVLVHEN